MSKYGIVILGNGFDLFHGHKTDYSSFIQTVEKKYPSNLWIRHFSKLNTLHGWVDLENEFIHIISEFEKFQKHYTMYYSFFPVERQFLQLLDFLGIDCENDRSGGTPSFESLIITNIIYKDFFDNNVLNYNTVKNRITNDFVQLKDLLSKYVESAISVNDKYSSNNSIFSELTNYDHLIIINFNYTNTFTYYNQNITNIFIHGDTKNGIVLGHNFIDNKNFAIINKHTQQHVYDLNYKYKFIEAINSLKNVESLNLITLGHSFDPNDHCIISWIYKYLHTEHIGVNGLTNFYYRNNHNLDFINRTHNIREFYVTSLGKIGLSRHPSENHKFYSRFYGFKLGDNYMGLDEFDYLERNNLIKNIELK